MQYHIPRKFESSKIKFKKTEKSLKSKCSTRPYRNTSHTTITLTIYYENIKAYNSYFISNSRTFILQVRVIFAINANLRDPHYPGGHSSSFLMS